MRTGLISLVVALVVALALAPGALAAPTTFTVTSAGDTGDAAPGNGICLATGGGCTLRAAIEESNAAAGGAPYTVAFAVGALPVPSNLPAIRRDGTFVDGCGVGRDQFGLPKPPNGAGLIGLVGTGAGSGIIVAGAHGVVIQCLAFTGFPERAVHLWGADAAIVAGNRFGIDAAGLAVGANGVGIGVTGRTTNGGAPDMAQGNLIGGPSDAADPGEPSCNLYCNLVVGSTASAVDLVGVPEAIGPGDAPAGGIAGNLDEGTAIAGNWIGVYDETGSAQFNGTEVKNGTAVKIGNAQETFIGGEPSSVSGIPFGRGNVIAGNGTGLDQTGGTTAVTLLNGTYGISPDDSKSVPNGPWNARLGGSDTPGGGAFVQGVTFGPAPIGLDLVGPRANLIASVFRSPDSALFTTAAVHVAPTANRAYIGSNIASPGGCIAMLVDYCNTIGAVASSGAGIWVEGADDARIWRNAIGDTTSAPLAGVPIRIDGGAIGADIGDNDDDPGRRNTLTRVAGPGIEVGGGANGIVIGDNEGLSQSAFGLPTGLFTDLLPDSGPGNAGAANGGIQPPTITQATTQGVGGTALPGATIHILQQQRKKVTGQDDPFNHPEGYTFPTTPSVTVADGNGVWGVTFPSTVLLLPGQKLMASQTTTAGSSEYASPKTTGEGNPPVLVTINGGPSGVVGERSASFNFTASRPVRRFECSVDAGAFVPCATPFTLNALDIGGHQLRVRGIDPTDTAGNIASRNWIIVVPEPVNQTPPDGGASAAVLHFSSLVTLPSAKKCVSRRSLKLRVRAPAGATILKAVARVRGRTVGSTRRSGSLSVSLKGLPRGSFKVTVTVAYADGRQVTGTRTYRTCAKKKSKKKPRRR